MEDRNLGKTGLKVSAMATLVDILHEEGCSCVISAGGQITICRERGIKDLFRILNATPGLLDGAYIADKVIGTGAAALRCSVKSRKYMRMTRHQLPHPEIIRFSTIQKP